MGQTRISYFKSISSDEVSDEVKGLVAELRGTLVKASSLAESGKWDFEQCQEVFRIAVALSKYSVDAALEAIDAVDIIELLYLPNLIGGASFPNGGGQPFEWGWHVGSGYFSALAEVVRQAVTQGDAACEVAVDKFLHEAKVKYPIMDFGGLHGVRKTVDSLVRDLQGSGHEVFARYGYLLDATFRNM